MLGTGKTLMARKIGQMLHAREPKIVNGPGGCGLTAFGSKNKAE